MRVAPVLLSILLATSLAGQGRPLRVTGMRSLSFGVLLPGVPTTVLRTDAANSGEWEITGAKFSNIQMTFTLPTTLAGPLGATIPVTFGPNTAGYSEASNIAIATGFDPQTGGTGQLSTSGRGSVYLGGTASPSTSQRAGAYTGTVILTVAIF